MEETKTAISSKTIVASLVILAIQAASIAGYAISPEDAGALSKYADQMVTMALALLAIYGRVSATKRIGRE